MVPIRFIASIALTALVASCTADPMGTNADSEASSTSPATAPLNDSAAMNERTPTNDSSAADFVSPLEDVASAPQRVADAVVASAQAGAGAVPAMTPPTTHAMQETTKAASYNELSKEETRILVNKGTEYRGTGELTDNKEKGTYLCRQCNAALYTSDDKFPSHCGNSVSMTFIPDGQPIPAMIQVEDLD